MANILLNEEEQTQLRGSVAGLNWAARQGRPDAASAASVIASTFPNPTVADARIANNTIARLKEHEVTIKSWSIPEEDLRRLMITDSAYDTSGQGRSQHGWIVGFTTPALAAGKEAPVSMVFWKSRKLRRKASSSLLCEALSGSKVMASLLKVANLEMAMRVTGHRHGMPLTRMILEEPTVLTKQSQMNQDPETQMVMDAKALYDAFLSEQQNQDDERAALECSLIKGGSGDVWWQTTMGTT